MSNKTSLRSAALLGRRGSSSGGRALLALFRSTEVADQANESAAIGAGIAFGCPFLALTRPTDHGVFFVQFSHDTSSIS